VDYFLRRGSIDSCFLSWYFTAKLDETHSLHLHYFSVEGAEALRILRGVSLRRMAGGGEVFENHSTLVDYGTI